MNHHLSTDLIIDYIHGELAPEDDALAHAHIAACADCRRDHDLELTLTTVLRDAAVAEERDMPSLVNAAVWQQIRDAKPGPLARLAAFLRPAVAVPVAAALVIAGGFFALPQRHAAPTIDASYYLQTHAAQTQQNPLSERTTTQAIETSMADASPATPPLLETATIGYGAAGAFDAVQ